MGIFSCSNTKNYTTALSKTYSEKTTVARSLQEALKTITLKTSSIDCWQIIITPLLLTSMTILTLGGLENSFTLGSAQFALIVN